MGSPGMAGMGGVDGRVCVGTAESAPLPPVGAWGRSTPGLRYRVERLYPHCRKRHNWETTRNLRMC